MSVDSRLLNELRQWSLGLDSAPLISLFQWEYPGSMHVKEAESGPVKLPEQGLLLPLAM